MKISMDGLDFYPLTPHRWDDLAALFTPSAACGGCWCMYWRETRTEFNLKCRNKGEGNREALHALVDSGVVPGILGYRGSEPLVWCSIAPREDFASLERSRNLKRLDDRPVWSIVCFYIAKSARRTGLMTAAIHAAVEYARRNDARIVEAYPSEIHSRRSPGELYMGNLSAFLKAGFTELETRGAHKLVRLAI